MSLERQLLAKQEALYWRERCLQSEQLAAGTTTTTATTDTSAMPPLIQIQPGIVGLEQPRIVGLERRRVTLMYQPDRQLQLQQMHSGQPVHSGQPMKPVNLAKIQTQAKRVRGLAIHRGQAEDETGHTLSLVSHLSIN